MKMLVTETHHTRVPRDEWDRGEWDREPDFVQWIDTQTDIDCMAIRNVAGYWLGTVGVPFVPDASHGLFTEQIFDLPDALHDAAYCMITGSHRTSVFYQTQPDRTDNLWWFTFDFGHAHDSRPNEMRYVRYHPLTEVVNRCAMVAAVLHELIVVGS